VTIWRKYFRKNQRFAAIAYRKLAVFLGVVSMVFRNRAMPGMSKSG
jgi:hypothetical protein